MGVVGCDLHRLQGGRAAISTHNNNIDTNNNNNKIKNKIIKIIIITYIYKLLIIINLFFFLVVVVGWCVFVAVYHVDHQYGKSNENPYFSYRSSGVSHF